MKYCRILRAAKHNTPYKSRKVTLVTPRTKSCAGKSQSFRCAFAPSTVVLIAKRASCAGENDRVHPRRVLVSINGTWPFPLIYSLIGDASWAESITEYRNVTLPQSLSNREIHVLPLCLHDSSVPSSARAGLPMQEMHILQNAD
jgi:hypothetical protein